MKEGESAPTGDEFERFTDELDSFLEGYFSTLGLRSMPAYAQGDFFYERTEAIHFGDGKFLTKKLITALQKWLSAPRRSNWRIVIPKERGRFVVIYHDVVVTGPGAGARDEAIKDGTKIVRKTRRG